AGHLPQPAAPLHAGADRRRADDDRARRRDPARPAQRRDHEPDRHPGAVPLRHPLPAGFGPLLGGRSAAREGRARPPRRLLQPRAARGRANLMARPSVFLGELTLTQVDEYLDGGNDLVLVPTGSTEQHGPHSPLSTDVIIPTEVCRRVASRVGALVAPSVNYGISAGHRGFRGLAYLSGPTFMAVVEDVAFSLAEAGFRRIVF